MWRRYRNRRYNIEKSILVHSRRSVRSQNIPHLTKTKDTPAAAAMTSTHLSNEGHEIVRYALRILPQQTALVRSDRIEVAQQQDVPGRISPRLVPKDLFYHVLCST